MKGTQALAMIASTLNHIARAHHSCMNCVENCSYVWRLECCWTLIFFKNDPAPNIAAYLMTREFCARSALWQGVEPLLPSVSEYFSSQSAKGRMRSNSIPVQPRLNSEGLHLEPCTRSQTGTALGQQPATSFSKQRCLKFSPATRCCEARCMCDVVLVKNMSGLQADP